jgi:uncharacterized protein (TIGR01777 family)
MKILNKKTVLIAGGSGLVGTRISEMLSENEYNINILTRTKKPNKGNIKYFEWDINNKKIDLQALQVEHIINLTGAGIADKRWSSARKKVIIDSRVNSLKLITNGLISLNHQPESVVCASAIGYYGNRGSETLTEQSDQGSGFLPECCKLWEAASQQLIDQSKRGTIFRIGIVLSSKGGALPKILMTKKLGVINYFGNGSQFYSFIHIHDLTNMIIQALNDPAYHGIMNAVSPTPMTNKDFSLKIAEVLPGFQTTLPAPAFALKLALGEMSAVVLDSTKVIPQKLIDIGFPFQFAQLSEAILDIDSRKV